MKLFSTELLITSDWGMNTKSTLIVVIKLLGCAVSIFVLIWGNNHKYNVCAIEFGHIWKDISYHMSVRKELDIFRNNFLIRKKDLFPEKGLM